MLTRLLDRFQPTRKQPEPLLSTAADRGVLRARVGAVLVDALICYLLVETPVLYLLDSLAPGVVAAGGGLVTVSLVVFAPLYLTYSFACEWLYGRTPGKVNRGLVVVMADGGQCTARASAVRNFARYVDFLGVPPLVVGVVLAWRREGRRLGDSLAGTVVVRGAAGEQDQAARAELDTDATARARR